MNLQCRPRYATPCMQYDAAEKQAFEDFLHGCGGQILSYGSDERAQFYTHKGSERCPVYVKSGYWVRCIGPGQFSVCSPNAFEASYVTEEVE